MTCGTCKKRPALKNNEHCDPCWRKWWHTMQLGARIREAARQKRKRMP